MQAGGRRFDSVHLHQLGHPVKPTPFRFSRRGNWFGAPRPEAMRVSRKARGRGCDEDRPTLPGFFYQSEEFGAPFTLFVFNTLFVIVDRFVGRGL